MLSAQSTFLKYKITICQRTSSLYLPQRAARLLIFRAQNTEKLQLPMYPAAHSITTSTWVLAKGRRIRFKETNLALPCSSQLLVFRHLFLQCSIPFAEKENSSANRGWIFFLFVFLGKNNVKVILQIHNRFGHRFWQCLGHSWVWHWHSSLRSRAMGGHYHPTEDSWPKGEPTQAEVMDLCLKQHKASWHCSENRI